MKLQLIVFLCLLKITGNLAQNPFVGTFLGVANGDNIVLTMEPESGNKLVGKMKDSQQTYQVNAATNGTKIEGTAVEKTMGLTFFLSGLLKDNHILMDMTVEVLGQKQTLQVDFTKQNTQATANIVKQQTPQYGNAKIPSSGNRDPNLVGKWVNEQTYNSGSGNDFFGGTTTQSLIFLEDGSLADGGSSTTVSGSNYYGSANGKEQSGAIPNASWYVQDKHIFIMDTSTGQTLDLGKYYIENGALLITGNNGKKLLLRKK